MLKTIVEKLKDIVSEYRMKRNFQKALGIIFRGYKKAEKTVKHDNRQQQIVWLSIWRFLSHGRAILLLCNNKHELEAMMMLRPLLELTVNTRWVIEDETGEKLKAFLAATKYEDKDGIPEMGGFWSNKDLKGRMKDIGLDEDYYRMVVKKLHEELHNHPARIARAYGDKLTKIDAESIYAIAAQMASHMLKAANQVYPDIFSELDYERVVAKIKPSEWHLKRIQKRKAKEV